LRRSQEVRQYSMKTENVALILSGVALAVAVYVLLIVVQSQRTVQSNQASLAALQAAQPQNAAIPMLQSMQQCPVCGSVT
jgi:hypothetical protein